MKTVMNKKEMAVLDDGLNINDDAFWASLRCGRHYSGYIQG